MDDYLSGLVEQNDTIPWEALRASAIAFRTYAYTVRAERRARNALFDVAASTRHTPTLYTRDQVYHGYARELSGTRLRDAIHDTRGCVLTYQGSTIHAVYFSRADGRTRSWHTQWGGSLKPWAVAVDDPYSRGQSLLGHGVGLPLRSANAMAADGANGEQILASYYTGTTSAVIDTTHATDLRGAGFLALTDPRPTNSVACWTAPPAQGHAAGREPHRSCPGSARLRWRKPRFVRHHLHVGCPSWALRDRPDEQHTQIGTRIDSRHRPNLERWSTPMAASTRIQLEELAAWADIPVINGLTISPPLRPWPTFLRCKRP